ncbi:hypothetical protein EVAR_35195_1 [Eumeta japonica]|uniref:Uncharacterized protein n=1 Tax=Eumeta variegata TaxID=151549 RepID=A0A4C1VEC7_EUMVA|nr:hypothetical protein EVAR_35195_1 [Eumeta japonica]
MTGRGVLAGGPRPPRTDLYENTFVIDRVRDADSKHNVLHLYNGEGCPRHAKPVGIHHGKLLDRSNDEAIHVVQHARSILIGLKLKRVIVYAGPHSARASAALRTVQCAGSALHDPFFFPAFLFYAIAMLSGLTSQRRIFVRCTAGVRAPHAVTVRAAGVRCGALARYGARVRVSSLVAHPGARLMRVDSFLMQNGNDSMAIGIDPKPFEIRSASASSRLRSRPTAPAPRPRSACVQQIYRIATLADCSSDYSTDVARLLAEVPPRGLAGRAEALAIATRCAVCSGGNATAASGSPCIVVQSRMYTHVRVVASRSTVVTRANVHGTSLHETVVHTKSTFRLRPEDLAVLTGARLRHAAIYLTCGD